VIQPGWTNRRPPAGLGDDRHPGEADTASHPPAPIRAAGKWVRILLAAFWVGALCACEEKVMTDDIYNVKRQNEAQLMSLPGVVSVGIGQDPNGQPAIVVGLAAAAPATERRVPDHISGFPVIIQTVGTIKAQ
jgi:hypothetical protein